MISQANSAHLRNSFVLDSVAACLIAIAFFALISATPDIPSGFDAYRHVKMARLLTENPAEVMKDPWRLAYLWPKPVDPYFGYHVLLGPLTRIFDLITAAKLAAALVFGGIGFVLLRILEFLRVRRRILWVAIALTGSGIALHRAAVARPFLFSILLVLLVVLFTIQQRYWVVAIVSALHAFSYSMFFFILIGPGLWMVLRRDTSAIKTLLLCLAGTIAGLCANPYFPENILYTLTNANVVNIAHKAHVEIGGELYPMQPAWFLAASIPIAAIWLLAAWTRLREWRPHPTADLFFAASILTLAGSIRVGRTFDFFVPFATLFAAVVLTPWLDRRRKDLPYLSALFLGLCAMNVFLTYRTELGTVSVARYRPAAEYLRQHAPGKLVANAQWGDYYYLFFWNPSNRYVIGIEPTFTYLMDPRKYWIWRHMSNDDPFTCDHEVCAPSERLDTATTVAAELRADYLFIVHEWNAKLEATLRNRTDVTEVFRDACCSLYKLPAAVPSETVSSPIQPK